jgi:undecaprenyl-diphosphatase
MMNFIQKYDIYILEFIKNSPIHSSIMDKIMVLFTSLGNLGTVWIVIGLLLIANKKYRDVGYMTLGALLLTTILGEEILKHILQRVRPSESIPLVDMLIAKPLSYSFPSGHTGSAFAAAGILSKYFKKYAVGIFALAVLIAFSRLYLYVHYPTDVLAGAILGLLCSKITIQVFNKIKVNKAMNIK